MLAPKYGTINITTLQALLEPKSTDELAIALGIPANNRQRLYTRLYELKRGGFIERVHRKSGYCPSPEELNYELGSRGRPKMSKHWLWQISLFGRQTLHAREELLASQAQDGTQNFRGQPSF